MLSSLTEGLRFLHVLAGTSALLAGVVALAARKGSRPHRIWGTLFVGAMVGMGLSADVLAVVIPDQLPNLLIGTFCIYLVVTSLQTVRHAQGESGFAEKVCLAAILCVGVPFAVLSFQLAAGRQPFLASATPFEGPVRVAMFIFTSIIWLCALGDARVIWRGGISGARRIGRHLWRMGLAFTLAVGSGFTNGLPRLLPDTLQIPLWLLFVPQLMALALVCYWGFRVRFTAWYDRQLLSL